MKNISKKVLLASTDETIDVITKTLKSIPDDILIEDYPVDFAGKNSSVNFVLIHLAAHLNYHLGQINYHRRLLDK
jgi:hypothetical protein